MKNSLFTKGLQLILSLFILSSCSKQDSYRNFKGVYEGGELSEAEQIMQDYYAQEDGRLIVEESHAIGSGTPTSFNVNATFEYEPNSSNHRPYGDLVIGEKIVSPYAGNGYSKVFEYDNDLFGDSANVSLSLSDGSPYFSTYIHLPKTTSSSVTGPLVDDLNISWTPDPGANPYVHMSVYYTHGFPKNIQFTEPEVENFLLVPNTGSHSLSQDLLDGVPVGALVLLEITQFSYKIVTTTSPVDNLPKTYKVMAKSTATNFFERQ